MTDANVIREPQTQVSRGFGFVGFAFNEDIDRAVENSTKLIIDDIQVVISKSKRNRGYEKTPGKCMCILNYILLGFPLTILCCNRYGNRI